MSRVWSFVVALLLAVGIAPAFAQRTTGEISGKVVDESGGTLPGVTVTLRGEAMPNAQPVITSETGIYRFPVLPAGSYEVEFSLEGFGVAARRVGLVGGEEHRRSQAALCGSVHSLVHERAGSSERETEERLLGKKTTVLAAPESRAEKPDNVGEPPKN